MRAVRGGRGTEDFLWRCDLGGENEFSDSMQMPHKDTSIFYSAEG